MWILLKQETVSGSGISWTICKSAPHSRQITMPVPHRSVFLQAGCPSCCPTNSIKAPLSMNISKQEQNRCFSQIIHISDIISVNQWFPSISDNGPKAISREVCGSTSENFLKSHRNQLLCTLNTNLLMPRLIYKQCNLTQNGLH